MATDVQSLQASSIVYTPEELRTIFDALKELGEIRNRLQAENTALVLKNRELKAALEGRDLDSVSRSLFFARMQNSAFTIATPETLASVFYEASTLAGQVLKELVRKGLSPDKPVAQ